MLAALPRTALHTSLFRRYIRVERRSSCSRKAPLHAVSAAAVPDSAPVCLLNTEAWGVDPPHGSGNSGDVTAPWQVFMVPQLRTTDTNQH